MIPDWAHAKYFKPGEVLNSFNMSAALLQMLEDLRRNYGHPITITGSWRPLDGADRTSAHQVNDLGEWEGTDLRVRGSRQRQGLLKAVYEVGFKRVGIYDRHIHVDVATEPRFAQNVCWIGTSK